MSDTLSAIYTIRPYNPMSLAIRAANPVSITKLAPASHVICVDGDHGIEASMTHGVRRAELPGMLRGLHVVERIDYKVPDAMKGIEFLRATAARKAKYDFKGAFGLGLAPGRNWQEDSDWFCFELFAMAMAMAGRDVFRNHAHVNAYMLMSLIP